MAGLRTRLHRLPVVWAAVVSGVLIAAPAQAALSCEQLFAIVQRTVEFRDQGYSLQQVLAGLKDVGADAKLADDEVQVLSKSVSAAYLGNASPEEIAIACKEARDRAGK